MAPFMYSGAECNHTILVGTFGAFWAAKKVKNWFPTGDVVIVVFLVATRLTTFAFLIQTGLGRVKEQVYYFR